MIVECGKLGVSYVNQNLTTLTGACAVRLYLPPLAAAYIFFYLSSAVILLLKLATPLVLERDRSLAQMGLL